MCEDEFKTFWQNHDYKEAVRLLTISYNWLIQYGLTSVPFTESKLTCAYLKNFYPGDSTNLKYEDLLKYWSDEHQKAVDAVAGLAKDEADYQAIIKNQKSFLDLLSSALSFSFPVLIGGIIILFFFLKK